LTTLVNRQTSCAASSAINGKNDFHNLSAAPPFKQS
jgi:hypothetical protein